MLMLGTVFITLQILNFTEMGTFLVGLNYLALPILMKQDGVDVYPMK